MKRSEFIAGFTHARKVGYRAQFLKGKLRPSEAAMGLADAKADAIRAWRSLDPASRATAAADFFSATVNQPNPGNPGNWAEEREATAPVQCGDLLNLLAGALRHLNDYKITEEVDSLSLAVSAIQQTIDRLPWLQDRLSEAVKPAADRELLEACKKALAAFHEEKHYQAAGGQPIVVSLAFAGAALEAAIAKATRGTK